jgi:hypothetical protein
LHGKYGVNGGKKAGSVQEKSTAKPEKAPPAKGGAASKTKNQQDKETEDGLGQGCSVAAAFAPHTTCDLTPSRSGFRLEQILAKEV